MKIIKWSVSDNPAKKYMVLLSDGRIIHFGSRNHQHYKDTTPLRAFAHLDHNDPFRKARYYLRHKRDYSEFSADWLAKRYLW